MDPVKDNKVPARTADKKPRGSRGTGTRPSTEARTLPASHGMSVPLLNQKNEKVGTVELPSAVFGVKWNPVLVQQVVTSQLANRRQPLAHTKTRGEVRGGGKKPWAQTHTGRARHGSSRSPLWSGGGVTFGPRKERVFERRVPVSMRRAALRAVLAKKLADGEVKVLDTLALPAPKTAHVASLMKALFGKPTSALLIAGRATKDVFRASRNLPRAQAVGAAALNVYDCLAHQFLIFEKDAIGQLKAR